MRYTPNNGLSSNGAEDKEKNDELLAIKEALENENRLRAREFVKNHNDNNPDDAKWILYGSHKKAVIVVLKSEEQAEIIVKIKRIYDNGSDKTFCFYGGMFIKSSKYPTKELLGFLHRLANRGKKAFDSVCREIDISSYSARSFLKKLKGFLKANECEELLSSENTEKTASEFVRTFLEEMWDRSGNPFCTPMEASG